MKCSKHVFFLLFLFAHFLTQMQAQHLNVEGNSRVRGMLDLGQMTDSASIIIGLGAGLNTDFSTNDSIGTGPALTFMGAYAGHLNTTGFFNTAMGYRALYSNTIGKNNTANGVFALENNLVGVNNTAMGAYALKSNTDGGANTAFGASVLEYNGQGTANTGIGNGALWFNTIGYQNTAAGAAALRSNTSGYYNSAMGTEALSTNTTGVSNTAAGYQALYNLKMGSGNTGVGVQSSYTDSIGSNNASFGYQAMFFNKTGSQNTALGSNAYFTGSSLSNTTCIGYNSGRISNASNRIEIGNTSISWIGGQVNWSTYSDLRIKREIQENVPGIDFINRLRPVTYFLDIHHQNKMCHLGANDEENWSEKYLIEENLMTGFIAQEVEEAAKAINYDFSGVHKASDTVGIYSLRYAEFVVPLVKAVQEQQAMIESLQGQVLAQNMQIDKLKSINNQYSSLLSKMQSLSDILEHLGIDQAKDLCTADTNLAQMTMLPNPNKSTD